MKNFYKTLEIKDFSDIPTVRKAFITLTKKYHPDNMINASKEEQQEAEEKQKEFGEAYATLSDPKKKKNYDEELEKELAFSFNQEEAYDDNNADKDDWEDYDFEAGFEKETEFYNGHEEDIWEEDFDFKASDFENKSQSSQYTDFYKEQFKRIWEEYFNFGTSSNSNKMSELHLQKDILKTQLQERESIIRENALPRIKEAMAELQKFYLVSHKSLKKVQGYLQIEGRKLVELKNRKMYQLMPGRFKEVENIIKNNIKVLEKKQEKLRIQIADIRIEMQSVYDSIITEEINKDAEIASLMTRIKFVELAIENIEKPRENENRRRAM